MPEHSMAITKNYGGGSNNHLPWLQHGSAYRQAHANSQNSSDPGDTKENAMPIVFVAITLAILMVRLLCYRLQKEEEAGVGDRIGQPPPPPPSSSRAGGLDFSDPLPPLLSSSRAGGLANRDPSTVAAVDVAPVRPVQLPLVCTYRKEDGWGDDSCGVCLAELTDGEALRVLPACMHFFHAACVNEWLRGHDTCPLCRTPLVAPADST